MYHLSCASDFTLGSSLLVLSALALSNNASDGYTAKLVGGQKLGMLGYIVLAWFAFRAYQLYYGQCKPSMSNPMIEQVLVGVGLGAGLFSLYLEYY